MVEVSFGGETAGNMAVSPGGPRDHAACDAEIARLRARSEAAEGKLAAIRDLCHDHWEPAPSNPPVHTWVKGAAILAITGTEGDEGRD